MKTIILIIVPILSVILINGCTKEPCEVKTNQVSTNGNIFTIGNKSYYVDVTTLDSAIEISAMVHSYTSKKFDIDKDGTPDFELYSDYSISPGGINYQKSMIKVLNPIFHISTIKMSDTLYKCKQITNDTIVTYTIYNNYSNFSCNGIKTTFSPNIYTYPKVYSKGDSLTYNESWINKDLILSFNDRSAFIFGHPSITIHSIIRGNWNNKNLKYLLFKKEYNGKNYYGWLKLSICCYSGIRLYEYAIQK